MVGDQVHFCLKLLNDVVCNWNCDECKVIDDSKYLNVVVQNTKLNSDRIYCKDSSLCESDRSIVHYIVSGGNPKIYGDVTYDISKAMQDTYNNIIEDLQQAHTLTLNGYKVNEVFSSPILCKILELAHTNSINVIINP